MTPENEKVDMLLIGEGRLGDKPMARCNPS